MNRQTQTYRKTKELRDDIVLKSANNRESLIDELRRLLAEFLGTFALILVAAGGDAIATISGGAVSPAARAVASALSLEPRTGLLGCTNGRCCVLCFSPSFVFWPG